MAFAIQHKGAIVTELEEDEEWVVVGKNILITNPSYPTHSRTIFVSEDDVEGLVEIWLGGA
ncbi:hypothetical protein [Mesorhizobium sp. M1322]|uniref:hypothetical protein n=1 Tax=Mesorhizobium sp. M1322 TaxID=2957081 RepID=UPI003337D1F5